MKRREGRGGGMGRRGFGRSRERRGRGKKKKGRRKIHRPHVLRFYESEGNRFRERKGAALIALPARSRGLGTRSFFLPPSLPLPLPHRLFCSYPRPRFLAKLDISTCPNGSQRVQRWTNGGWKSIFSIRASSFNKMFNPELIVAFQASLFLFKPPGRNCVCDEEKKKKGKIFDEYNGV